MLGANRTSTRVHVSPIAALLAVAGGLLLTCTCLAEGHPNPATMAGTPCFAQTNSNPATITGTSSGGVGFVTQTTDPNGISAGIGEWGIPYTGGLDGPPQPGAEPSGPSIWTVTINVNDGGILSFNYQIIVAQTLPPVSITVSQSNVPGGVNYQYRIVNHSAYPITSVVIGMNYFSQRPELQTAPAGWSVAGGIPPSSVSSPTGWAARIITTEDTDLLQLEWTISAPANAIAPEQTTQGFGILVPKGDSTYASADWTVYIDSAGTNYYTGTLTPQTLPCDTPSLSVSLSPNILWPPNHNLVKIDASVSTSDENYPNPTFQLVSITANETLKPGDVVAQFGKPAQTFQVKRERSGTNKAGRVYTVTYSATNSCGNSATTAKTIVVPHDQGGAGGP